MLGLQITALLLLMIPSSVLSENTHGTADRVPAAHHMAVCHEIASQLSSASSAPYTGSARYEDDISHNFLSSTRRSACSVEPGTVHDVGLIMKAVARTRTPFAGGGHAYNPEFSSTLGVHISMTRFSKVAYNPEHKVVDVGSGLRWDHVYAALEHYGVAVAGARASGVGVGGLSLGGGYSWLTNQYGLVVDNIVGYEVVLSNGTVVHATASSHPDLFFGLKGGCNNFGVVTKFTMRAHPLGKVWGGNIFISGRYAAQINSAIMRFVSQVDDPKAALLPTYGYREGQVLCSVMMFYAGSRQPPGIFNDFLSLPSISRNISTRSYLSLKQSIGHDALKEFRGINTTPTFLNYTKRILDAIVNETSYWGPHLSHKSELTLSYAIEPFLPSILSHGKETAWPPTRSQVYVPTSIYLTWTNPRYDDIMANAIRASAAHLTQVAMDEGQDLTNASPYGNYAIFVTPVDEIFGQNLARMRRIKDNYDPQRVMDLAGGWKV
ncbi:FAD-binding domain-containing protein [Panus rudis PR-1116 ss-1]|nr:FAD-binding domain-containing protein [Panus rudis PR-1116 ss-1]